MTPEERYDRIDRQLEFLANHQAHLSADIQGLWEIVSKHSAQIDKHTAQIEQHTSQIGQIADLVLRIGRIVEEQGRRTDERIERLAEAQGRTDERLNTLISVVERYFSNGRH